MRHPITKSSENTKAVRNHERQGWIKRSDDGLACSSIDQPFGYRQGFWHGGDSASTAFFRNLQVGLALYAPTCVGGLNGYSTYQSSGQCTNSFLALHAPVGNSGLGGGCLRLLGPRGGRVVGPTSWHTARFRR